MPGRKGENPKDLDEFGLTMKERQYADLYRGGPGDVRGNQTACYMALYPRTSPKNAKTHANKMHQRPQVQAYLRRRLDEASARADVSQEQILAELAALALSDVRELYDEAGNLRPPHEWPDRAAAAVAGVDTVMKRGASDDDAPTLVTKVKLWDKNSALDKIARHLGMYAEDNKQRNPLSGLNRDQMRALLDAVRESEGVPPPTSGDAPDAGEPVRH